MKLVGRWHECHDGVVRPLVLAEIPLPSGRRYEVLLLVDTGTGRTSLTASFARRLGLTAGEIETDLFLLGGSEPVTTRTLVLVEEEITAAEYSTLGRDLLDDFTVLLDRTRNVVALLTADHGYTIADA